MKKMTGASAIALALLLSACGGGDAEPSANKGPETLEKIAAPNNADWTETVGQTQEGWIMGNPNAPVKLVEYASITCPHCKEFSEQGGQRLREYVRTGQVSWEYRPFLIFPTDPAGFMLLRCLPAQSFFAVSDQLYHSQDEWMGRLRAMPEAQLSQAEQLPREQQAVFFARGAGLDQFFRQRGLPGAQVDQCLANQAELQRLVAITDRGAREERVPGTPAFLINGTLVPGADTWREVEAALQQQL
jgi:protein-disulfide isomerase